MRIESIIEFVGNTPLLKVNNIISKHNLKANLFAKLEMFNASGSIKMRIVKSIIMDAINKGLINNQTMIVEASSGNTGIALACLCAALSLKVTIVMPENVSLERKILIESYGALIVLTPKELGMEGAVNEVKKIVNNNSNTFLLSQFENFINPLTHKETTAKEIYDDLKGEVDIVIGGIGTGGTITGIGEFYKEFVDTTIIGVEPFESPLLNEGISRPHKIEGIGANFIPKILNLNVIDRVEKVSYEQALEGIEILANLEGLLVGISSGAAFMVGYKEAIKNENEGKNIVVILPDGMDRYISKLKD